MFVVIALVAWAVEFATHLHVNQEVQDSGQDSYFCEMCAAFQAGASNVAAAQKIPQLRSAPARAIASVPSPRLQLTHSYRSRAPPHA